MKTIATSLVAAALLAAATASPALAGGAQPTIALGSGSSCLPNAVRCKQGYRPGHPRCITIAVRQNGTVQKKRVCYYR
ncbi:MAG: hypothetical protein OEQ29_13135 [Alphaproteobacteria bacterium]|nr:hypothetical protein [Alphaproteobacteria bacterium]